MALLDARSDTLVVRIVYDGPPKAGKTTSVRALASGLGASVLAPEEADGRTVYFDWLDYTGGLFEGRRIRCQIVTVPGQATLASRRRHLLQSADAVVFVADCDPDKLGATRSYFEGLLAVLRTAGDPVAGVVVQANKADLAGAVAPDALRSALEGSAIQAAIIESVATDGAGIREAFVFAVRLALDRARELMRAGTLNAERPEIDSADDLLAQMRRLDGGALNLATENGLSHIHLSELSAPAAAAQPVSCNDAVGHPPAPAVAPISAPEVAPTPAPAVARTPAPAAGLTPVVDAPALPEASLPSGMIWPPVSGRVVLHAAAAPGVQPVFDAEHGWIARAGRWTLQSSTHDVFADVEAGRSRLLQWARQHATSQPILSAERCIALAQDGQGGVRLWQVVRAHESLRDLLDRASAEDAEAVAAALLTVTDLFLRAGAAWAAAACRLPLSLDSIGATPSGVAYLGLVPNVDAAQPPAAAGDGELHVMLARELGMWFATGRARYQDVFAKLEMPSVPTGAAPGGVRRIVALLEGELAR